MRRLRLLTAARAAAHTTAPHTTAPRRPHTAPQLPAMTALATRPTGGTACVGFRALLVQGSGATACVVLLCSVCQRKQVMHVQQTLAKGHAVNMRVGCGETAASRGLNGECLYAQ